MKFSKILSTLLLSAVSITSINASAAALECAPSVLSVVKTAPYNKLDKALTPAVVADLKTKLENVKDQASYGSLLSKAHTVASSLANGRLVVTLADGTVVVDTGKTDDPNNGAGSGNSYGHYNTKTVNENHNSRIAIINAQLHPCGVGVERKLSTTDRSKEYYVAKRLGDYLMSSGTVRLSVK
jgi:hypothetical protein